VPPSRRERRRERRIREVLNATARILRERGYRNLTLEEVAEELDVAKATLYHYFDSKESLVYECLRDCHAASQDALLSVADGEGTPRERLRGLIQRQLNTLLFDESDRAPLFVYPLDVPREIRRAIDEWRSEHDEVFRRVIAEGIEAGEWSAADARIARLCLHGALNGVREWASHRVVSTVSIRSEVDAIADVVMRMFVPPARADR
jgi:AcrR family transcriptional regulator